MSLSIFTNSASMTSMDSLNKSSAALSQAMQRLATGLRINSAADDAAGLQIASRLNGQVKGMDVAKRNINDATSLLQTAEGSFDEVTNILYRMKDLATQSSNDTNTDKDRKAMQSEFDSLNSELSNIMSNSSYGGESLFISGAILPSGTTVNGKFASGMQFQIGDSAKETMSVNFGSSLKDVVKGLAGLLSASGASGGLITTASGANAAITKLQGIVDQVSSIRSDFGATINRLQHSAANLANKQDNTSQGLGTIQNADYAQETSNMTRSQMLSQIGISMLKQSNNMSGMVMSLIGQ